MEKRWYIYSVAYVNTWIDLQHLCNLLKLGCNQTTSVLLIALKCIDNAVTTESIKRLHLHEGNWFFGNVIVAFVKFEQKGLHLKLTSYFQGRLPPLTSFEAFLLSCYHTGAVTYIGSAVLIVCLTTVFVVYIVHRG